MSVMKKNRGFLFTMLAASLAMIYPAPGYSAGGATITGKVHYTGAPVKPVPIQFGAERQCAELHKDDGRAVNEEIVVNPDNTLRWALVYIKEDVPGDFPAPAEPAEIDQDGCLFTPHVAAARVGQQVIFKNGDPLLHNVRSMSNAGQTFNIAQPIQGMQTKKVFKAPEIGVHLRCDVHYWMSAYLHVMKNPYFTITGGDGSFMISGLPAGTYTLELWHEKLGTQSQTVTVADGEVKNIDFSAGA